MASGRLEFEGQLEAVFIAQAIGGDAYTERQRDLD